jgi:hypothetical protein
VVVGPPVVVVVVEEQAAKTKVDARNENAKGLMSATLVHGRFDVELDAGRPPPYSGAGGS